MFSKTSFTQLFKKISDVNVYYLSFNQYACKREKCLDTTSIFNLRFSMVNLINTCLSTCYLLCRLCADRLHEGIEELGLELFVTDPAKRLPTVTTIKVLAVYTL